MRAQVKRQPPIDDEITPTSAHERIAVRRPGSAHAQQDARHRQQQDHDAHAHRWTMLPDAGRVQQSYAHGRVCRATSRFRTSCPRPGRDPYRRLRQAEYVSTSRGCRKTFLRVEPETLTLLTRQAMRDISHLLQPATPRAAARHPRRRRGLAQRPVRGAQACSRTPTSPQGGILPSCQDLGHGHRHGREGPAGVDGRRRRGRDRARHLRDLPDVEPALLAARAARHVQGVEHGQQPAGADRALRHRRRRLQVPVLREGEEAAPTRACCSRKRRRCSTRPAS